MVWGESYREVNEGAFSDDHGDVCSKSFRTKRSEVYDLCVAILLVGDLGHGHPPVKLPVSPVDFCDLPLSKENAKKCKILRRKARDEET